MSLWMPGAVIVPGHPEKIGYQRLGFGSRGPKRGDVKHSAEGWASYLKFLIKTRLAIKSWHFTLLLSGTIWQHYPIDAHCWHAGDTDDDDDVRANIELVGIEHEGLVGTPLTAEQTQATVEITKFCAEYFERSAAYARFPVQPSDGWTLVEHTEVSNAFTACPSDRIPWDDILELLTVEEDDMTFIGVGHDKAKTGTHFQSFRLYVTAEGLRRDKIATKEEREALAAAGYPLTKLTKAQLEQYAL